MKIAVALLTLVLVFCITDTASSQIFNEYPCTDPNSTGTYQCSVPKGQAQSPPFFLDTHLSQTAFNTIGITPLAPIAGIVTYGDGQTQGGIKTSFQTVAILALVPTDIPGNRSLEIISNLVNGKVEYSDSDAGGNTCPQGGNNASQFAFGGNGPAPAESNFIIDTFRGQTVGTVGFSWPMPLDGSDFAIEGTITPFPGTGCDLDSTANFFVSLSAKYSNQTTQQNLNNMSTGFTIGGVVDSLLAFTPVGKGAKVATVLNKLGAGLGAASLTSSLASTSDPPDFNYTTVVTPTPPNIDTSSFGPAAAQLAQTLAQIIGEANAIYTTTNRATGAHLDQDANSEQLQTAALPGFESQLEAYVAQLPAQYAAFGQELLSEGLDTTSVQLSDVISFQQSLSANGLPAGIVSDLNSLGISDPASLQLIATNMAAADPNQIESMLQSRLAIGPLIPPSLPAASNIPQVSAILPASRSAVVGNPVTAFVTIINAGSSTATGCVIAPTLPLPINFEFQTTNPATNALTGTLNAPVNIAPGAAQSFVIVVTPTVALPAFNVSFSFYCSNANPAPISAGLNTLLLSASTTPVPDVVALAASGDPGIVDVSSVTNAGAFAVATVNLGSGDQITVTSDTNGATLPLSINICQTVPATGACLNGSTPAPSVTTQINPGDTPTFGIFVSGTSNVPFDPANNRVFVRFTDSTSTVRGATSVAVRTH
jgi:hypothetical protein